MTAGRVGGVNNESRTGSWVGGNEMAAACHAASDRFTVMSSRRLVSSMLIRGERVECCFLVASRGDWVGRLDI